MRPLAKHSRPRPAVSTALLSSLEPSLTLPVRHTPPPRLTSSRHTLELRGPVVHLLKPRAASPASATLLILRADAAPRQTGPTTAVLQSHRLRFSTPAHLASFLSACAAALSHHSAPAASRYTLLSRVGRGASGQVYLARRVRDGRVLALKAIDKLSVFSDDAHLAHVLSERAALSAAARRGAAAVIRLVDAFETARHLCFVTELAAFGDLHSVLARLPLHRVSERAARALFADTLLGLEDLHRAGFLYRDLKLANLLLTASGHVRVADLGLAKRLRVEHVDASDVSSVTASAESGEESAADEDVGHDDEPIRLVGRTRSFVGTRRYMSPEHVMPGCRERFGYGAPADVWALGVSLYIMLTGEYPFGRDLASGDSAGMSYAIAKEEICYPKWLSDEGVGMLKGLLDRDALERFDISEIKSHPWLKGVDWAKVRTDAALDKPQEEIVKLLEENGVRTIDENCAPDEGLSEELFSCISGSGSDSECRKRQAVPNIELLGFGYLDL